MAAVASTEPAIRNNFSPASNRRPDLGGILRRRFTLQPFVPFAELVAAAATSRTLVVVPAMRRFPGIVVACLRRRKASTRHLSDPGRTGPLS